MADPAPIIIIGAARSGTKFLRGLLAMSPGVCAVPYDVNYVWRSGAETHPDDRLAPVQPPDARIAKIRRDLGRLARLRPGRVLLEKTVSNTLRVPFVDQVFPEARYIHLLRDGRDVAESAIRQWQAAPDKSSLWRKLRAMPLSNLTYALWFAKNYAAGLLSGRSGGKVWGPRFPEIESFLAANGLAATCARQWAVSVETASRDLSQLPRNESRVYELRYEALVQNDRAIADLVAWLHLPQGEAIVRTWKDHVRRDEARLWESLSPTDRGQMMEAMQDTLARYEYTG